MKISQMPLSTTPSSDDVLAMLDGGTQNKKITFGAVAEWIANEEEIESLNTDSKTLVGAVNELSDNNTELKNDLDAAEDGIEAAQGEIETLKDTAYIVNTVSGDIAVFADGAAADVKSLVVNIEPIQAAGIPSPDNILPISGRTGATVYRTGKNLFGVNIPTSNYWASNNTDGITLLNSLRPGTYTITCINKITAINGTQESGRNHWLGIWPRNENIYAGNLTVYTSLQVSEISVGETFTSTRTITITDEAAGKFNAFYLYSGDDQFKVTASFKIQIELGTTATAYEPYTGTTYPVSWETEAGTVYGGELDAVSSEMVVTHEIYEFTGNEVWTKYETGGKVTYNNSGNVFPSGRIDYSKPGLMSRYPFIKAPYISVQQNKSFCFFQGLALSICDDSYSDAAAFAASMAGSTLVYPLAEPQTYTLTPQQIQTLLGNNVIWSDAGSVSVDYRADTKLYIEQLTKPTEDDVTANTAIQSGKFFMIGNRLFLSTAAIASGDTINPGTNCTELSLADALNNLN